LAKNPDNRFVLTLDHKYGSNTLRTYSLRGGDRAHHDLLSMLDIGDEFETSLKLLGVETFTQSETQSKDFVPTLVVVDENKKLTSKMSRRTKWLNIEQFTAMEHEFSEYEYYTGKEGYATGLEYMTACIVIGHEEFNDSGDY